MKNKINKKELTNKITKLKDRLDKNMDILFEIRNELDILLCDYNMNDLSFNGEQALSDLESAIYHLKKNS